MQDFLFYVLLGWHWIGSEGFWHGFSKPIPEIRCCQSGTSAQGNEQDLELEEKMHSNLSQAWLYLTNIPLNDFNFFFPHWMTFLILCSKLLALLLMEDNF